VVRQDTWCIKQDGETVKWPKNFKLWEFLKSDVAARKGIDNTPDDHSIVENLKHTAWILQELRNEISRFKNKDTPMTVSSGFRCKKLNQAIKGAKNSDHMKGLAADVKVIGVKPADFYKFIKERPYLHDRISKVILEFDSWVHISIAEESTKTQFLIAKKVRKWGRLVTVYESDT